MNRIIYVILLLVLFVDVFAGKEDMTDVRLPISELKQLDNSLREAKKYDKLKMLTIDSLQKVLKKVSVKDYVTQWHLNMDIGDQFKAFSADSALNYYRKSCNISNYIGVDSLKKLSEVACLNALSAAGIFPEAVNMLDSLEKESAPETIRIELMKAGRQLYSYMLSYVDNHQQFYSKYNDKYNMYDDELLKLLPKESMYYKFVYAEHLIHDDRYKEAKQILEVLMKELPDYTNLYGMCAYQMAEVYRNQGDETQYARYLALSAISDIKGSIKETMSLPTLANWLYEQGDLDRAFNYINASLQDAMTGNARMRTVAVARFVPMIDNAYRQKINSSRNELMIYFILVTLLLLISGVLLFVLMRQMKRIREAQQKLAATSKIQDSYIGNFLGLCSSYADKLESMSKLVSRKISAGQTDELLKLMKSGKFTDDQNDDFYKIFDNAFLDLYPDFVDEINKLLRAEEQIVVKNGLGLSPELRIYAFVRLGVEESTKISQILHYSVSTIYAYRNRMRNRAINRDTFDSDVMKIGRNFDL